jgi:hypothetical protein
LLGDVRGHAAILAQPIGAPIAVHWCRAKEVSDVEFALNCPNDGRVDLGIEDISAVVFRDPESVEVVFTCPQCGTSLRASLRVPNMLAAAVELARYAEELDSDNEPARLTITTHDGEAEAVEDAGAERERAGEPYCEYFRRQLARVECVEDLLTEIDGPTS